jgi:hypothetical protein
MVDLVVGIFQTLDRHLQLGDLGLSATVITRF